MLSHLKKDTRLLTRDVPGLLVAIALPLTFVFAYSTLKFREQYWQVVNPDAFILVLASTLPVLLVASTQLVVERNAGTFERLGRTPANVFAFCASKTVALAIIIATQVVALILSAAFLGIHYGERIVSNAIPIVGVLFACAVSLQTVGLLIGAAVRTEAQAMQLSALAFLVLFTFAGFLVPFSEMGGSGDFAPYTPLALGYVGVKAIIAGPDETPPSFLAPSETFVWLCVWIVAALGIAAFLTYLRSR